VHDFVVKYEVCLRRRHSRVSSLRQANLLPCDKLRNTVISLGEMMLNPFKSINMFEQMGFQTLEAYSRTGRTYVVYARRNKVILRLENPLNNIAIRAYALETTVLTQSQTANNNCCRTRLLFYVLKCFIKV